MPKNRYPNWMVVLYAIVLVTFAALAAFTSYRGTYDTNTPRQFLETRYARVESVTPATRMLDGCFAGRTRKRFDFVATDAQGQRHSGYVCITPGWWNMVKPVPAIHEDTK